ncbi:MAG TPA: carbamoyltransferase [Terriglobia bacterium]|nr:carbamoyltransferase [Terriglobia bacterium]
MMSLGINYAQTHDSSACIARDGEILFAVAEERLSRVKHDGRFPALAIRACLDFARVRPDQLDYVAFGWSRPRVTYLHDLADFVRGRLPISYLNVLNSTRQFVSMQHQGGGRRRFVQTFGPTKARILFVDHHLAHAISAYANSGFDEAAVGVVDGRGAWEATSIWHGRNGKLEHVLTLPWPNSLGLFYAAFTEYLGFQPYSDEWKVMGLAPYGQPGVDLKDFVTLDHGFYVVDGPRLIGRGSNLGGRIAERLGPKRVPESEIESRYKDVAFAVQHVCEQAMKGIAEVAVKKTGCRKLCMAGGVALNSKANGLILKSDLVESIFVQPAASDDGVALGAALAPYLETGERLPLKAMRQVYLGAAYEDSEIEKVLRTYKLRWTRLGDEAGTTADLLAAGKITGWFQGRMEFGPRALGCRSILADPRDPEMNAKVNNAVKFREWWRPFAPSLLAESAGDYLESAVDSPFMILTSPVKLEKRSVIPAVTHIDGSARPQTVEENVNPLYWRVIKEFGERTGVPVIMNTSFNLRGEPIVCSPTDAIRTFFSSGMDALVIGSFLVEK